MLGVGVLIVLFSILPFDWLANCSIRPAKSFVSTSWLTGFVYERSHLYKPPSSLPSLIISVTKFLVLIFLSWRLGKRLENKMPLPISHGERYVRISRVFIDSEERSEGTVSDYRFDMNTEIQEVVGVELTGYVIPSSLTPSFLNGVNDKLDFELSNGVTTKQFSATWPSNSYTYENVSIPYLGYINTLLQILEETVFLDPVFGNNGTHRAFFLVQADPETRTDVSVLPTTGITSFRFLFDSGPNSSVSAFREMGFSQVDTPAGALEIVSPNTVKLDAFPRVDIFIDEFPELRPLDTIYNRNAAYYGTTYNDTNISRTPLLSSKPPQRLKTLHIRLRIGDKPVPNIQQNEHSICLTIFSLANEEYVPRWLNQSFVL